MVGSYPRPHWFDYQLLGRDVRVAFKHVDHQEAYEDATEVVIHDQEEAGLDFVTAFFGCLFAGAVAVPAYPRANRRSERLRPA